MALIRTLLFLLLAMAPLFAEEESPPPEAKNGYTINYNTVSISEYIKFASKICNTNFIFNEEDLDFTVSVVSDAPITSENVMATLVQVLRIHGLMLLEQGNSLVIHKSDEVKQIAKLVTESGQEGNAAIVTRIFRLKNAKVESIAGIVQPMISTSSILESSPETRQLILTDVTSNVNKVAALIEVLDSPHTPLDIQSFDVQYNQPEYLIEIAMQIMHPIAQGNPFILVPQNRAHSIFIVSTPELIEKAINVLKSLDISPKKGGLAKKFLGENVFVYKAQNRSGEELLRALNEITDNIRKSGIPEDDFVDTISSARWIQENNSLMFLGSKESVEKVREILTSLDTTTAAGLESGFFLYRPQSRSASEVQTAILEMAMNLKGSKSADDPLIETMESVKINPLTQTLVFSGEEKTFPRIRELLATIDPSNGRPSVTVKNQFFVYKIERSDPDKIETGLKKFAKSLGRSNISDEALIESIQNMKYIKETNSILFTGPEATLKRLEELVPTFDNGSPVRAEFFIYKPKNVRGDQLAHSMKEITSNLKSDRLTDPAFLHALQSMKWVKSTNSLLFTGDAASIKKVEDLVMTIDAPGTPRIDFDKNFFLYQPQYATREKTETYLKQIADNLHKRGEEELVGTIHGMKWIEASQSFMFHGNESSLTRLKELLKEFDTPAAGPVKAFYIYAIQYAPKDKIDHYLERVASNLEKTGGDHQLVEAIKSRKWIEESRSIMFQGTELAIGQLKDLLKDFDTLEEAPKKGKSGYYLYKVQHTTGGIIEEDLESLAQNFKASEYKNPHILDVIEHVRYIRETNSLLLTGDPQAIEEVKKIIAEYDYPREDMCPVSSNFYMYKPQEVSASQIQKSLREVGSNLKKANLADPSLLAAIDSVKYVEATNSLIFTGSPEALEKIKTLIKDIDAPPVKHTPIQRVGKTTFLLYKLKHADGPQIISSLKTMVSNLKKSHSADKDFISAVSSVKYIKETNSLLFTGTEDALNKIHPLVEQFDVVGLSKPKTAAPTTGATNFFIYKPQSLAGPELEKIMHEFAEHLKISGLTDPDLYNAIESMRFIEKTQSLVFTGTPKALDQVKELLTSFDIPSNLSGGPLPGGPLEPSIQAIDNTSFLVYKLQFHKGDEIQGALRQIAKDLTLSQAPINQNLLISINSIQWLEVTNSLLCSGDQETLTRLRELIKNLDIPLKQVFIEMLVLETTLSNALSFGLEWGGNYKYRNKFGGSMFNTQPAQTGQACSPNQFVQSLGNLTPPAAPTPIGNIPPGCGFDLGVIGEVIKHNGSTFLTLGSLLSALQSDTETSVIMTPKIITQDGRTSSIFVGQNVPFAGSFVTNQGGTNTLSTANLEYRDIGLNLTVTPVLGNSDVVTLDISLDRTSQSTDLTGATITLSNGQSGSAPTTSKTNMQTTVHVPNKNFLILSGFVNSTTIKTKAGIPCLGGLPIIGAAFSKANDTISNDNIVIFMRPHIITSLDDMQRLTTEQEEYFRDQVGTPYLEHNYDEAMELIKSIDDE